MGRKQFTILIRSVANSLQNFSASPVQRKIQPLRKKIRSSSKFHFLKEFGLKKNNIFVCVSGKISCTSLELESIRGGNPFGKVQPPFWPFLFKIGQNLAADLSGHSTFYSLFDLCGRAIGQLATLLIGKHEGQKIPA
jgi:hypothetical protein